MLEEALWQEQEECEQRRWVEEYEGKDMPAKAQAATNHLKLWEQVEKTDPQYTKPFSRGGGFRGTATNATYLARRATETFGPMGIGWGLEILDESLMEGAPLDDKALARAFTRCA